MNGRTLLALWAAVLPAVAARGERKYQPTWESLKKHPVPKWFRDAKFGIYFHWGPYSVPAYDTEWYSRNMYREKHRVYKHHVAKYGHPSKFGYKDFLPKFTAARFDADEWVALFAQAGAKFAGPVAEHADGFAMWDSALTRWDAADVGPKRDIVGQMAKAVRKRRLKFIVTFHHGWNWDWYPVWDKRFDCSDPRYAGLYGQPHAKGRKHTKEFLREWKGKVIEVIDKYRPDLLWFDSKMGTIDEKIRLDLLCYYYNKEAEWGRQVGVTYKRKDLPAGAGILDLERGRMDKLTEFPWLNDDSIDWRSWCHIENPSYKSVDRLVDGLVDIVSKNGNLLLNFGPKANGEIPRPVRQRLIGIGRWLKVNGEAIYGTRPWTTFGEGPTEVKAGMFSERHIKEFTPADIRFTVKGNTLYAIALGWPAGGKLTVKALGTATKIAAGGIKSVSLLGCPEKLRWNRAEAGLTITLPDKKPHDHAYAFRIEVNGKLTAARAP